MSDWTDYHRATSLTAVYGHWSFPQQLGYAALGVSNEAGEVAGEIKKVLRDDGQITTERRAKVIDELGDVFWYAARLAEHVDATLEDAAAANIAKVHRRLADGTLQSSGNR